MLNFPETRWSIPHPGRTAKEVASGKGFFVWGTRRCGVNLPDPHASEEFRDASTSECWTLFVLGV